MDQSIQSWHGSLLSRRVDLIGDYAGNECFLVDGDSLLLEAFSDPHLDFDQAACQLLHAIYNVENLLKQLKTRKCNFHLVFFDDHEDLCIPATSSEQNQQKYLLARAAFIRHIQSVPKELTIPTHSFTDINSSTFARFLKDAGYYFMMTGDGSSASCQTQNRYRWAIHWFMQHGGNVVLINGLEYHDSRIIAMVLERKANSQLFDKPRKASKSTGKGLNLEKIDRSLDVLLEWRTNKDTRLSERDIFTLLALRECADSEHDVEELMTFLLHTSALAFLPLISRYLPAAIPRNDSTLFNKAIKFSRKLLENEIVIKRLDGLNTRCDVADLIDGRLFCALLNKHNKDLLLQIRQCEAIARKQEDLIFLFSRISRPNGMSLKYPTIEHPNSTQVAYCNVTRGSESHRSQVLPFKNPVFDKHLRPIQIDASMGEPQHEASTIRLFKEVMHWHNRRSLAPKGHQVQRAGFFKHRRNQQLMAEMVSYAASLTNASGKQLNPEIIVVKKDIRVPSKLSKGKDMQLVNRAKKGNHKLNNKKGEPPRKSGRESALAAAAARKNEKHEQENIYIRSAWASKLKDITKHNDAVTRISETDKYLNQCSSRAIDVIEPEVILLKITSLYALYAASAHDKTSSPEIEADEHKSKALIFSLATYLVSNSVKTTPSIASAVNDVLERLHLPALSLDTSLTDRPITFDLSKNILSGPHSRLAKAISEEDARVFQLEYCGPYMERSFNPAKDDRVPFEPDAWQREVLDAIDDSKSLLVIAPTSAGKTFISFYAMKKVLASSDDSVLVYVAPTKALVNQIAAEVQARFSKELKHDGRSVWGIHTRDYRVNNPTGCQILVTVPHILQILLLSPVHAEKNTSWSNRISRIIFDEVHCIGQADDGLIWEQLLLLAPCPIIALSATVGNPNALAAWLESTQAAIGHKFVTIQHHTRYSDLRKFVFRCPSKFEFAKIGDPSPVPFPGLDASPHFHFIHPVASLVDRSRDMSEDLTLEPRDCLTLYRSLCKHATDKFPVSNELHPHRALPERITKSDVFNWEKGLKHILKTWMNDPSSSFEAVLHDLSHELAEKGFTKAGADQSHDDNESCSIQQDSILSGTLPMLVELSHQDALPAILFNYDRVRCEQVATQLFQDLASAESTWKQSNKSWQKEFNKWTAWRDNNEKELATMKKISKQLEKRKKKRDDADLRFDKQETRADRQADIADASVDPIASFDPDRPIDGYHFADWAKLLRSELHDYQKELRGRGVSHHLVSALERGIGIHHAGMNRKYRQIVEILFRKGFLRVVIATGTLALGINMPCKTVVFSGDSVFLTALNFRQAAGRAGRRGFDVLGNVVFQGISFDKVCRLMSSRLPDLNGHFPITTSLVLRLCTLLHSTKNGPYASRAVDALLSQPRLCLGGDESKMSVLHHVRFSIEYLRRQALLGSQGEPINFAGLISHLYYTESAGFAFHALLKGHFFHSLCAKIATSPEVVLHDLVLTLANLFGRLPCPKADEKYMKEVIKPSPSVVLLPQMPNRARDLLQEHNEDTLKIYLAYVTTFVDQHLRTQDCTLPFSELKIGPDTIPQDLTVSSTGVRIRSPFVALSGYGDEFISIDDLCATVRAGVFLENSAIPYIPVTSDRPLNAYLYDFFKHANIAALTTANRIPKSNVWFLLNEFSLVLAVIVASIKNFMGLSSDEDAMDGIRGNGDAAEEAAGDASDTEDEADLQVTDAGALTSSAHIAGINRESGSLKEVLQAFILLKKEFDAKFRTMWS